MKLILISLIVCLVIITTVDSTRKCQDYCTYKLSGIASIEKSKIRLRKDIKCLTDEEWKNFATAVNEVHKSGIFGRLKQLHDRYFRAVHDHAMFFIWHRLFIYDLETELLKIHPKATLPYWDAAVDFSYPLLSNLFKSDRFGGNGVPCVQDGIPANWIKHSHSKCVLRNFAGKNFIPSWHSPEWITHILQTGYTFDHFRASIEQSIYSWMYNNIGGSAGDLSGTYAPNDPLFFIIIANLDRIYAKWQLQSPYYMYAYDGPIYDEALNVTTYTATLSDRIPWFNYTVGSVIKFGYLPYTYDDLLAKPVISVAHKRLSKLPKNILEHFYPQIYENTGNQFHYDLPPGCFPDNTKAMDKPSKFHKSLFEIRGFDSSRAFNVNKDSNLLIDILNSKQYCSPYQPIEQKNQQKKDQEQHEEQHKHPHLPLLPHLPKFPHIPFIPHLPLPHFPHLPFHSKQNQHQQQKQMG